MFQIPNYRGLLRYVYFRAINTDNFGLNFYPETLVEFFKRVLHDGICNGLIPAGVQLVDSGGRICIDQFVSNGETIWNGVCPKCMCRVEDCKDVSHMGEYSKMGRYMFLRILEEVSKQYFWMFCTQYAKFCTSVMLYPTALSQVSFHSTRNQLSLIIPFLPIRYKDDNYEFIIRQMLGMGMFQETPIGKNSVLFPKPCMLLLEPSLKNDFIMKSAIVQKLANFLGKDQFNEAIIRRVLNAPNRKRLCLFKAQNSSFCKKILESLLAYKAHKGLILIFEALC
jgi:hypothetical protein